jgi:hypothetical protein
VSNQDDSQVVDTLIEQLQSHDFRVQHVAIVKLGKLGDARAVEPLIQILENVSHNPHLRAAAAVALGEIGDPSAVKPLVQALNDSEPLVQTAAREALRLIYQEHPELLHEMWDVIAEHEESEESHAEPADAVSDELAEPDRQRGLAHAPPAPAAAAAPQYGAAPAPPAAESPQFSAFYPEDVQPGQPYALMVFAHLESARDQVRRIAAGYAGMMGGQPHSSTVPSTVHVEIGRLLTFVPLIQGITFEPAEQVLAWQPPYQSATFLFTTPSALESDLSGRVLVFQGPLVVGEIPVSLKVISGTVSAGLDKEDGLRRYDPVFASYSHRDAPVMEYFRRARENIGQKMLVDIYDLRAGEHWEPRLLELIDQCAVFQLFWSKNSAQSEYCEKEWRYALRHAERRPRFIQPVWWEAPMPDPPGELKDLHFQKVTVPPLTRAQLAFARVRRVFGRT